MGQKDGRPKGPARVFAPKYKPRAYWQAVRAAAKKAGVPHWFPYQVRHTRAEQIRDVDGIAGVQAVLGHHQQTMSERYAGPAVKTAARIARGKGAADQSQTVSPPRTESPPRSD